jgi:hypothetical protein
MIIAAPDGSVRGKVAVLTSGSFFLNSRAGNFEDYIIQDVYSFVLANYPVRPEREAKTAGLLVNRSRHRGRDAHLRTAFGDQEVPHAVTLEGAVG